MNDVWRRITKKTSSTLKFYADGFRQKMKLKSGFDTAVYIRKF
jgi:hypothetical protein